VKNEQRNYVVVGTFVIAMVAVLIVWISLLAGQTGNMDHYSVVYTNLSNLKPGARVLFEGFPVGHIDEITPTDRDDRRVFRVGIAVEKDWPIPANSTANITQGLFSAAEIDIRRGNAAENLAPDSEIAPEEATDIVATLKTTTEKVNTILDDLGAATPPLMQTAQQLLSDLRGAIDQVNDILGPENVRRISSILKSFDQATDETNRLLGELRKSSENITQLVGHLDDLVDKEGSNVSQVVDDTRYTMGTVARHIDAIAANLEDTTRNLSEFSKQLRTNPAVLLRGRQTAGDGSH